MTNDEPLPIRCVAEDDIEPGDLLTARGSAGPEYSGPAWDTWSVRKDRGDNPIDHLGRATGRARRGEFVSCEVFPDFARIFGTYPPLTPEQEAARDRERAAAREAGLTVRAFIVELNQGLAAIEAGHPPPIMP
jgi:hypothetical protein